MNKIPLDLFIHYERDDEKINKLVEFCKENNIKIKVNEHPYFPMTDIWIQIPYKKELKHE